MLRLVDIAEIILVGDVHQLALQVIGPGMILAAQHIGMPAILLHHLGAAMAAGVVEGADFRVLATHDQNRRADLAPEHIIARPGDILLAPDAQPGAAEDMLHFQRVEFLA